MPSPMHHQALSTAAALRLVVLAQVRPCAPVHFAMPVPPLFLRRATSNPNVNHNPRMQAGVGGITYGDIPAASQVADVVHAMKKVRGADDAGPPATTCISQPNLNPEPSPCTPVFRASAGHG